jgi:hypothetical protein
MTINPYLRGSIKAAAVAAVLAVGLPVAGTQAQERDVYTAVVLVSCELPAVTKGHGRRDHAKKNFAFEASSNTPRKFLSVLMNSDTCTDAMAGLKSGDPNPKCSTSAALPNNFVYSCDLTAPTPPGN